ncbi:hypothetical protein GCM10010461_16560 [Microbacterium aurantiacum]
MAAPRKYPDELRERAIRMAVDLRRDPATRKGALARVGEQLGINPETLRNWVTQAEVDAGDRPGTTTSDAQRLAELERENRELRRANAILRSASASSRRSSTAHNGDRGLHRRPSGRVRGRADLQRVAGRSEHVLRGPVPAAVGPLDE